MNKFGLLVTGPVGSDKNIGDYIQSLAALQYTDGYCCYIEKERIALFNNHEKMKTIMNAWYMWHPDNWPPMEEAINPLLISMHISPLMFDQMLACGGKEYLIAHGPVGCRDTGTLKLLKEAGVPSYFSACLTLTLGRTYRYQGERKGVYFVDAFFPPIRYVNGGKAVYQPMNLVKAAFYFFRNMKKVSFLARKSFFKGRFKLQTYYNASMFYQVYSSMFTDDVLLNAEYSSHMLPVSSTWNHDELLDAAKHLLHKYARAKLVVTSRIHCALPCLGLDTPVVFVTNKDLESTENRWNTPGRFGGLMQLFRVVCYNSKNRLRTNDRALSEMTKFSGGNVPFVNKDDWREYEAQLHEKCMDFMKS